MESTINLDKDVVETMNRRAGLASGAKAAVALLSAPLALGVLSKKAFAATPPKQVVDVLNFALTLEYLEDEFYQTGLNKAGLIPSADRAIFNQISKHEASHVELLKSALGSSAVSKPAFDFTAKGKFNPFGDYAIFKVLAQGFEDTGVRAYKGQAGNLMGSEYLTTALQIHSVEARHASEIRRLRGQKGWVTFSQTDVPALAAVYAGENNTSQGGVTLPSTAAVTEAFDEPLSKEAVLAIAGQFLA